MTKNERIDKIVELKKIEGNPFFDEFIVKSSNLIAFERAFKEKGVNIFHAERHNKNSWNVFVTK